ncbi:ubiquitin-like protein 7 [Diaphorina citri]|nr:ubiquitin-like protein 7 [Diaphorina citri]
MMQIMSNLSTPGTASSSGAGPSASSSSVTSPAVANPNPINPMEQYASQIQQMRELGLTDELVVVQALQLTNGDVTAAVNLVFSGTLSGDSNN